MKTALITCHQLVNFAGSECMVLDFANELKHQNVDVTVATLQYGYPIKEHFEKNKIKVVNLLLEDLNNLTFDYLICFHNIVLSYLLTFKVTANKKCFFSLGPNEALERPMDYNSFFNIAYFNSPECLEQYSKRLDLSGVKKAVFLNSVSRDFEGVTHSKPSEKISKIAVISNHPPPEVKELTQLLNAQNIEVVFIGRGNSSSQFLVTPNVLNDFDVVLTIGRTVQYSLMLGIPVFCYDRFGGPGYINLENIELSEKYNFSGRCLGVKYNSQDLCERIIATYDDNIFELEKLQTIAIQRYSLTKNLNRLIEFLDGAEKLNLDYEDANVETAIHYANLYVKALKKEMASRTELLAANRKIKNLEVATLNYRAPSDVKREVNQEDRINGNNNLNMKLSVSFNFFNGEELLFNAIKNIREAVEHISVVYQNISNQGHSISDEALEVLENLKRSGLVDNFIEFKPDLNIKAGINEFRKRDVGLESAKVNRCTHFLSMDADEFYEKDKFIKAKKVILEEGVSCSVVPSYFYIKKPIWRSLRLDNTKVCFIVKIDKNLIFEYGAEFPEKNIDSTRRFINKGGTFKIFESDQISMHHMSYVRKNLNSKLLNSSNAKGNELFMEKVNTAFEQWEFGKEFYFPNQEPHKIIEVQDVFKLLEDQS